MLGQRKVKCHPTDYPCRVRRRWILENPVLHLQARQNLRKVSANGADVGDRVKGESDSSSRETEGEDWVSEDAMYNEPEEYQIGNFLAPVFSSSDWYRNGRWYVNATAEGIWRSSGKSKVLAKDLSGVVVNTTGAPILDQSDKSNYDAA